MQTFTITVSLPDSTDQSALLEHLQTALVEFAWDDCEDDLDDEIEESISDSVTVYIGEILAA